MKKNLISIITPFYNEDEAVDFYHQSLIAELQKWPEYDFEVVCIDDGSSDQTLKKLIALAQQDTRFKVIELSRNFGKESALTAGLHEASGIAAIPIDADLQDPISLISELIKSWQDNDVDVVLAKRVDRASDTYLKRNIAKIFYKFHNSISAIAIPENVGDCRLINRNAIDAIKSLQEHHRFMKGLFAWIGFKTAVVEFTREKRVAGSTKFRFWKLWNFGLEGITSFSTVPIRVWTYIGGMIAMISFLYALTIITKTLFFGIDVPGYASLIVITLFLGGLQLLGIGMLGEYVGRSYIESKGRPSYIIRKIHAQ